MVQIMVVKHILKYTWVLLVLVFGSGAFADESNYAGLIGRTLGLDMSFSRECKNEDIAQSDVSNIFLGRYSDDILFYADSLGVFERREFLSEFISFAVRGHADCETANNRLLEYWGALQGFGLTKDCIARVISSRDGDFSCE